MAEFCGIGVELGTYTQALDSKIHWREPEGPRQHP